MGLQKRTTYLMMIALMFAWGIEYIFAKQALDVMEPLTLVFFKYLIGFVNQIICTLLLAGPWALAHMPANGAGGAVVIAAGCLVIKEKGRLEELPDDRTN